MRRVREINAIIFTTLKCEVQSLKSELRALRAGHLSTSDVRLPWTPEEKHRHEANSHAECDNRCEICVKSNGISRHFRRVYSESCAFDNASVTFKESGPRCECFCRVVPRIGQRLKDLEHFLAVIVEESYPTPHIHEQMTTSNYGYDNINLEPNAMNNIDTVAHMNMHYTQY